MLKCRDISDRASALVDGELDFAARLAVQMHVLMCANCRRLVRHLRCLVAALRQAAQQPFSAAPDAAYVDRILASLPSSAVEGPGRGDGPPAG